MVWFNGKQGVDRNIRIEQSSREASERVRALYHVTACMEM
jgi:hypothetical protein